jgi:VWFA-related protein
MRVPIAALFLALLVPPAPGLPRPSSAQVPPAEPSEPAELFGESIAITEVEIPVQVLHRGEPVRGLTAEDFQVFDAGEPAEVVGFRVVDLGSGEAERADAGGGEEAERYVLYLFDFLLSSPRKVERALFRARDRIVGQLRPGDRVGVGYLSPAGGRVILASSSDPADVGTALDVVEAMTDGRDPDVVRGLRRLSVAQGLPPGGDPDLVRALADARREIEAGLGASRRRGRAGTGEPHPVLGEVFTAETSDGIKAQAEQVARVATSLRDVPGPRHLLLLTEGFRPDALLDPVVLRDLRGLFGSLRRSGWTLHAFDIGGIPDPFDPDGTNADALFYLANETGGQLLANYNRLPDATETLLKKISVTYVLTIRPPADAPPDGRLRRIDVRLKDDLPGSRLHHRTAYSASPTTPSPKR